MGYAPASGERRWQPALQEGSTAEQAVEEARKALRDTVAEEQLRQLRASIDITEGGSKRQRIDLPQCAWLMKSDGCTLPWLRVGAAPPPAAAGALR